MIMHDLARRWPERDRIFSIDAALDGVAVKLDVALRELELAAGGDADLFEHEIDVGDHLGHRVLDLDARVHLDEIKLAVLVEELDRADAEIFELAHRLGDGFADGGARGLVERGAAALFPDLLIPALQRAVALAQMDGTAVAVAQHLDFDVARMREIFLEIKRVVAERGLGLRARGRQRCNELLRPLRHLHAAPAAAGRGLEENRKAEAMRERYRLLVGRQAAVRSRHHRHAEALGRTSGFDLVAHQADMRAWDR